MAFIALFITCAGEAAAVADCRRGEMLSIRCDNAREQVAEVEALQQSLSFDEGCISLETPNLLRRLKAFAKPHVAGEKTACIKRCVELKIDCSRLKRACETVKKLNVRVVFPCDYPLERTCDVSVSTLTGEGQALAEQSRIVAFLAPFAGNRCVECFLDYMLEWKDDPNQGDSVACFALRYNHLLKGNEHKKEKSMLSEAKSMKLQGCILWGTPGVVLVVPDSSEEDAKEFSKICREIGKRADGPHRCTVSAEALDANGVGGLGQRKRGGKLKEIDKGALRDICKGDDDVFKFILGIK